MSNEQAQAQNRLQELRALDDKARQTNSSPMMGPHNDYSGTRASKSCDSLKEGSIVDLAGSRSLASGWEVLSENSPSCKSVHPTSRREKTSPGAEAHDHSPSQRHVRTENQDTGHDSWSAKHNRQDHHLQKREEDRHTHASNGMETCNEQGASRLCCASHSPSQIGFSPVRTESGSFDGHNIETRIFMREKANYDEGIRETLRSMDLIKNDGDFLNKVWSSALHDGLVDASHRTQSLPHLTFAGRAKRSSLIFVHKAEWKQAMKKRLCLYVPTLTNTDTNISMYVPIRDQHRHKHYAAWMRGI